MTNSRFIRYKIADTQFLTSDPNEMRKMVRYYQMCLHSAKVSENLSNIASNEYMIKHRERRAELGVEHLEGAAAREHINGNHD